MLEINNLSVSFGSKQVLQDLDLQMPKGMIHGIIGMNGAGKTTLLNTIASLIKPDSGTVNFEEKEIGSQLISYLETKNYFYSKITGKEYLDLFKSIAPDFQYQEWNQLFDLPLDVLVENYSTGMKKKLAFMAILSQERPVLILDEPFHGIDLETNLHLRNILGQLVHKGRTILITSHILGSLTEICDQIHFLADQKIEKSFHKLDFDSIETTLGSYTDQKKGDIIRKLLG